MSRRQNNQQVKLVKVNDISIGNSNEISNTFNEHFATIGPKLACEIPSTSDEVFTCLNNFPVNFVQPLAILFLLILIDCQKLNLLG